MNIVNKGIELYSVVVTCHLFLRCKLTLQGFVFLFAKTKINYSIGSLDIQHVLFMCRVGLTISTDLVDCTLQ
jgi:hypothetical protein